MRVRDIWAEKSDHEVLTAFAQLDQYTAEAQNIIRAEYERRYVRASVFIPPSTNSIATSASQSSQPEEPSKLTQAHLSSLDPAASTATNGLRTSTCDQSLAPRSHVVVGTEPKKAASDYEYMVIPFTGQSKGTLSADDVARQLESVIAHHASAGWEFCQLSDVSVEVQPGCLAGLFGSTVQYARLGQLIFKRTRAM